ncbi:MAG: FAD binding domain-containing protein [Treponema sp.]|nr:FAD binding domain-containing protein [Treponema sp.]
MERNVFFAKNITELLYLVNTTKDLTILGGCTRVENLPQKFISIRSIPDLCRIERHEKYLDIGPGATLSQILNLGENHLPKLLYDAILSVGNPTVRNMATLGGNILNPSENLTLFAPLLALDTKIEITSQNETKTLTLLNYKNIPDGFIVKNFRVPLNDGEVSIFKRVGPEHGLTENSASFAFIANTEKNSISSISLAFAGPFAFRSKDFENLMIGQRLPLSLSEIKEIQKTAKEEFTKAAADIMMNDVMRQQFVNLVRYAFEQLM